MRKYLFFIAALAAGMSFTACGDDKSEGGDNGSTKLEMSVLEPVVDNYADAVVLPTYKALMEKNSALYDAVAALCASPSDKAFEKAADAWLAAGRPLAAKNAPVSTETGAKIVHITAGRTAR